MLKPDITNANASHNLIAEGTLIKGEITTNGDFRMDGHTEGTIFSKGRVIIGESGKVIGNIQATNVDIMGYVEGKIDVSDTLSLKSTGKIKGDIRTKVLVIEQHAEFNGSCQMGGSFQPNALNELPNGQNVQDSKNAKK